jgi:phospholipase C
MGLGRRALLFVMAGILTAPDPGLARTAAAPAVARHAAKPPKELAKEPAISRDALIRQLRQKVKYVFVIFNENHSFDNEFGTFPGANGVFSDGHARRDAAHTPGFTQSYKDTAGQSVTVTPFRIGPEQNATFVDSVDHTHKGLAVKLNVVNGKPMMDGFAAEEYARFAARNNPAMGTQFARLVMSYIDCDTIPLLWNYANRFTLFDNIFATEDSPSTPNAIAMIAGQAGETQWVRHGSIPQPAQAGEHKGELQPPPFVNDSQPFYGSQFDPTPTNRQPPGPAKENYGDGNISQNMTFASLPMTLTG